MLIIKLCQNCGEQFVGQEHLDKNHCKECLAKEKLMRKKPKQIKRLRLFRVKETVKVRSEP